MQRTIKKRRKINKPINEVWEALSDPKMLDQWFMEGNFKAEESARFEFLDKPGEKWKGVFQGEVLSSQPPINLAYSWNHSKMNHTTYVWWKLEDVRDKTILELEHSGFKGLSDYFSSFSYGFFWNGRLKKLANFLSQSKPEIKERTKM